MKAERAGRPFDVILMDISMVRMNGDEVCKQMRGAGFNIPMVAMTGVLLLLLVQRVCKGACLRARDLVSLRVGRAWGFPQFWGLSICDDCMHASGFCSPLETPPTPSPPLYGAPGGAFCAGNATGGDLQHFLQVGFDCMLPKPFDLSAMERTLVLFKDTAGQAGGDAGAGAGAAAGKSA